MAEPEPRAQEDVEMESWPENGALYHAPPAHIAARFHRRSSSRRRSSTHSSRRSSMSSLHSHRSNLSCHGGPQSTHIAQHLRRASIIESRKARLADRAAHAEQVRLRAALAKAQPRASLSEEKMLAAQAAREKLLAEITARCEEEVRRAKKIAEETKEKKAAEHARLKQEMADKFEGAARRRSIYQLNSRRPRTTSLAAVEEKKINPLTLKKMGENAAAKVIQRAWRNTYRRGASNNFAKHQINLARMQSLTFEDATQFVSEEQVLRTTKTFLKVLGWLEGNTNDLGERGAVRVFLSAYMLVAHPVPAFSHCGQEPQERDLLQKGRALIDNVESFIQTQSTISLGLKQSSQPFEHITFLWNEFSSAFHAWKAQDLTVIIDVMVNTFVNLDLIIQSTKNDHEGRVAEDYFHAVRQEQVKLLARLKKMAGPEEALSLVRTAVRKARKQRVQNQRRTSDDNIPRTSSYSGPSDEMQSDPGQVPTPPATPEPPRRTSVAPSLASRLSQTLTVLPSNREISHEIQITGNYEVQQQPWTQQRKLFADLLQSNMQTALTSGNEVAISDWTQAMVILVRDKILNLVSPRHPLYDRIDGLLDPKLIEQQTRNGMFSYADFFDNIGQIMAETCSPGRDDLIREFIQHAGSNIIDRLFALINIVDLMTLDHINFQFRMAASQIIEHGHEHEEASFRRYLEEGQHSLRRTRSWWLSARSSLHSSTGSASIPGHMTYARALTDLVFSNRHLDFTSLPEILHLDWIRLLTLRARAFHIVVTSSILLTTKIRLRRNRESLWTRDAERLLGLDLISTSLNDLTSRIVGIIESSHSMPESTREGLTDFIKRVLPPAIAAASNVQAATEAKQSAIQNRDDAFDPGSVPLREDDVFSEQVTTYHLKTTREHIFARLAASSTAEKVRVTTSVADVLARAGMPEFVSGVSGMGDLLERVRQVDLMAHQKWLDGIAGEN